MKEEFYLAEMQMQQNVEERVADAEQARLAKLARGRREARRWRLPLASTLQHLMDSLKHKRLLHREVRPT